jgi:hypothetical protein
MFHNYKHDRIITRYLAWRIIIVSLLSCILFFIIRTYILQDINYPFQLVVLDITSINFKLNSDILSAILTLINHFSSLGFIQNRLGLPEPINIAIGNGIYTMDEDKVVGGSIQPSNNSTSSTGSRIILGLYNDELVDLMQTSIKGFKEEMAHLAKNLNSCTEHYNKLPSTFSMYDKGAISVLINHLQGQSEILNVQLKLRLS